MKTNKSVQWKQIQIKQILYIETGSMRNVCVMLDHKLMLDMLKEYSSPLQCTL